MSISFASSYLKSLFFSTLVSFISPLLFLGGALLTLLLLGWVPGLEGLSQWGLSWGLAVLDTFGAGNPLEGLIVIGSSCACVGALFDTYIFYRQQSFRR
jgi:hypothetical protein